MLKPLVTKSCGFDYGLLQSFGGDFKLQSYSAYDFSLTRQLLT